MPRCAARRREAAVAAADAAASTMPPRAHAGEGRSLTRALAGVPAETRRPFLLHHVFGFSFPEIAARLGIRTGAAKVRSSRAGSRLRALLSGGGDGR